MSADDRKQILEALRAAPRPFQDWSPPETRVDVAPVADTSPAALLERFVSQAEQLDCTVATFDHDQDACQHILDHLGDDDRVVSWAFDHIPLLGLDAALEQAGITLADPTDSTVRVGITGADAALAATGSLVLVSGPGKPRTVSFLPDSHVAVIRANQIVANMEAWHAALAAGGLAPLAEARNLLVVSGPSRTADIAMELILGAHGPRELHILIVT